MEEELKEQIEELKAELEEANERADEFEKKYLDAYSSADNALSALIEAKGYMEEIL